MFLYTTLVRSRALQTNLVLYSISKMIHGAACILLSGRFSLAGRGKLSRDDGNPNTPVIFNVSKKINFAFPK